MKIKAGFVLLIVVLFLTSCASRPVYKSRSELLEEARSSGVKAPSIEQDRESFLAHENAQKEKLLDLVRKRTNDKTSDPSYRLGAQDEIEINVFDVPELNINAPVRESGFVNLPLIGALKASGLTLSELGDELKTRLSSFVRNPQVSLFISHYGSQKVAVLGAVNKPDMYPLKKGTNSIIELIGEAGGISQKAGNLILFVPVEATGLSDLRDLEAKNKVALSTNLNSAEGSKGVELYIDQVMGTSGSIPLDIPVRGGDMIVVPEAGKILVEGEVEKIGSYDLAQQMTLLGGLAAAGGITYSANVEEIEILRELNTNKRVSIVVDLNKVMTGEQKDLRLRNGDIVRVPSNPGKRMTSDTFEGFRKLLNFGIGGSFRLGP